MRPIGAGTTGGVQQAAPSSLSPRQHGCLGDRRRLRQAAEAEPERHQDQEGAQPRPLADHRPRLAGGRTDRARVRQAVHPDQAELDGLDLPPQISAGGTPTNEHAAGRLAARSRCVFRFGTISDSATRRSLPGPSGGAVARDELRASGSSAIRSRADLLLWIRSGAPRHPGSSKSSALNTERCCSSL
jgi:hypothetical protein